MLEEILKKSTPFLKKIIPKGKARDIARITKFKILNKKHNLKVLNNYYALSFKSIENDQIFFPKKEKSLSMLACLYNMTNEIPGYFQKKLIKKGDTIIDAGAWPGDFTVIASRLVGNKGKIFAFEPDPENVKFLKEVIRLNKVHNVEIIERALYEETTKLPFYSAKACSVLCKFTNNKDIMSYKKIKVKTVALDYFSKNMELDGKTNLIKMDVEGAELSIMNGAKQTLKNHPNFLIASYHLVNGKQTYIKLKEILNGYNYDVKTIYPKHLTTYAIFN